MLTVLLHLNNGAVITTTMTRSQRDRVSRTLNQEILPNTPYEMEEDGTELLIPWRSIGYISTRAQFQFATGAPSAEAAD